MNIKTVSRLAVLIILSFISAAAFISFLYRFDNKYITALPSSQQGTSEYNLSSDTDSEDDIIWLIDGWEFCPDEIIAPGNDSAAFIPIYIGQYFSFSDFHNDGSPFGYGTYRIELTGYGSYTLLIPEVFCACRVYVNNTLAGSSGSLSPYEPFVKDVLLQIDLDGKTEILIQTANYTHYYSGITYPPAIGSTDAVNRLIVSRMLFYGFICFTSLALAVFASVVWIGIKKQDRTRENLWLGVFALTFSFRVCYPFIHYFGSSVTGPFYALENCMTALGILCVIRAVSLICLVSGSLADRVLTGTASAFVLITFIFPLFMLKQIPQFTPVYGQLIYWYKALTALALIIMLLYHAIKKEKSSIVSPVLFGMSFYAVSLAANAYYLGTYEPARFGWFEEWACYILILCFTARIIRKNILIVQENHYLTNHLQEEVNNKTKMLTSLLNERRALLASFAHDLKTPLTSIITFTRLVEMDSTDLDPESKRYLDTIREKTKKMQEELNTLSDFAKQDTVNPSFESVDLYYFIQDFYNYNLPDLEAAGLRFDLSLSRKDGLYILADIRKLTSIFQNLVYNAASFASADGYIRLCLKKEEMNAIITVEDNGPGISPDDVPHIFDRFFTHRKDGSGQGLGLFIVKSLVTEQGGQITVQSSEKKGCIFTVVFPLRE